MQTIDAKGLAQANPKADAKGAERAMEVVRDLQRRGILQKQEYKLAMPFGGRRPSKVPADDPRTVTVKHRR